MASLPYHTGEIYKMSDVLFMCEVSATCTVNALIYNPVHCAISFVNLEFRDEN
jgi:hypothetical protein